MTSFYIDQTYTTAVSNNHSSKQFVIKPPQNWQK